MNIKVAFNTFLQLIYKTLAGLLSVASVFLIAAVLIAYGFNLDVNKYILLFFFSIALVLLFYIWKNYDKISDNENKNSSSHLIREIIKLTVSIVIFSLIVMITNNNTKIQNHNDFEQTDEMVTLMIDSSQTTSRKYYISNQVWKSFDGETHRLPFKVNYDDVIKSKKNKEDFKITYRFSWENFYKNIADNDRPLLEDLAKTFFNYQKKENMNRRDFAELMISAIQDIPYNLILSVPCEKTDVKPCFGNVKLGIYTPAEFISTLSGDCDTRTVILFTLLSRFNYDVAILNSKKYKHSVLGLNIHSTGKFKTHNNKKYYFIETTAKGCPIGYLHQDVSNVNYWGFALIYNTKIKQWNYSTLH